MKSPRALIVALLLTLPGFALAATPAAPKPLRILLITGGCCHDYAAQKDLLKQGLEARAHVVVEHMHTADKTTRPSFPAHTNPHYADGYDLVIHDECAADIADPAMVQNVLAPHLAGLPGVNLHCAMHSYRVTKDFKTPLAPGSAGALWFDYLGLQSSGHGKQAPISIAYAPHPATAGLNNWTTINEELYNNIRILDGTIPLAKGTQEKETTVVAWAHEYGPKKTKVFSTTIGHNNETVADPQYLDLVTRGILWSTGKLTPDGHPAPGYAPAK